MMPPSFGAFINMEHNVTQWFMTGRAIGVFFDQTKIHYSNLAGGLTNEKISSHID